MPSSLRQGCTNTVRQRSEARPAEGTSGKSLTTSHSGPASPSTAVGLAGNHLPSADRAKPAASRALSLALCQTARRKRALSETRPVLWTHPSGHWATDTA
eukprot:8316026-Alexandrium_andersonii.AAC.2